MPDNILAEIALWGYGVFGKRTAESMKLYWGGEYVVKKIYDSDVEKQVEDPWWKLDMSDPNSLSKDYHDGLFEKVMICVSSYHSRKAIEEILEQLGIPWFFPGRESVIVPAVQFGNQSKCSIHINANDYFCYSFQGMLGAVSDHDRSIMYVLMKQE